MQHQKLNFAGTQLLADTIQDIWGVIHVILQGFWDAAEKGFLFRRGSLVAMWFITFESYHWCFEAARATEYDPMAIAACFAILTPVSGLQALIMKFYGDSSLRQKKLTTPAKPT